MTEQSTAIVSSSQSEVASQNGSGRAIKIVRHSNQASNSRTAKTALGLKQIGWNS